MAVIPGTQRSPAPLQGCQAAHMCSQVAGKTGHQLGNPCRQLALGKSDEVAVDQPAPAAAQQPSARLCGPQKAGGSCSGTVPAARQLQRMLMWLPGMRGSEVSGEHTTAAACMLGMPPPRQAAAPALPGRGWDGVDHHHALHASPIHRVQLLLQARTRQRRGRHDCRKAPDRRSGPPCCCAN
jgi:hypothetical protein